MFLAPHVVAQALKTAVLAAALFESLGLRTSPERKRQAQPMSSRRWNWARRSGVIAFCRGIQAASPVDSMAVPEPWAMPGYLEPVIMAAGTFVSGASIELSADAPLREPYTVYLQGSLTYEHGKIALIRTLEMMEKQGYLP